jgi:predicted dehydrogenase
MSIGIAAVGLQHGHVHNQVKALLDAGAKLLWVYEPEQALVPPFVDMYPGVKVARALDEVLDDPAVHLVIGTTMPSERADLGIAVMQRGKDYSCDKPGVTSFEQLAAVRRVQAETGRLYTVHFGEHYDTASTITAGELVQAGAIGRVVQTMGTGPHRFLGHGTRPAWAFDKQYFGGIINDLASHQIEQFLFFTDSAAAEVVHAQVGNFKHTQFEQFEDFGDLTLRSATAAGYIRVDWLTPPGLPTWGDGRLFILGTDGYIEIRKYIDIGGRPGKDHLFLVNGEAPRYIDCADAPLTYGRNLIHDVLHRTQTAFDQARCFLACELALTAQAMAVRITPD